MQESLLILEMPKTATSTCSSKEFKAEGKDAAWNGYYGF